MNIDSIEQLPEKYRKQARNKLDGKSIQKATRPKYGSVKTKVNNITFDSKKEADRYLELLHMQDVGMIQDLRLQVNFTLLEGYTTTLGERIRPRKYVADFTYKRDGQYIVEDVKSKATRTRVYLNNKKDMADKFGIMISEV